MDTHHPSSKHIAAAKSRLTHMTAIGGRTADAERRILDRAEARLEVVDGELAKFRPRVNLNADARDGYMRLTLERGQLVTVIAQSRRILAQ